MEEGLTLDKKSLLTFSGDPSHWDWQKIAKHCVAFANARGGTLIFGIEDHAHEPSPAQIIPERLGAKLHKGVTQHCINVSVLPDVQIWPNGGQTLNLQIHPSLRTIAATTDGRYYMRIADESRPLMPDELPRLVGEKDAYVWEAQITRRIPRTKVDQSKLFTFLGSIRSSQRVSEFLKQKPDDEILDHYLFTKDGFLTNLGILWIGQREDRALLLHAPVVQFIKYDHRDEKVNKIVWDDYHLNPAELIEAIWTRIPDWRESSEVQDGLFRKNIPHYDEVVIRELVANALVHRPYTTRGDIFLNLHAEYLEIHNPGLLPLGVTPRNILHATAKRNPLLAQVFYDLKLMEREGSGYDRIYEILLMHGKPVPETREENDRVVVRVERRVVRPEILEFLARVDDQLDLRQRERISLGLIAQHGSLTAAEFARLLELPAEEARLRAWVGSLIERGLVSTRGRTRATEYCISTEVLRQTEFRGKTTLKGIEPHRLKQLVLEDLRIYAPSPETSCSIGEIHGRIGTEISRRKLQRALLELRDLSQITLEGSKGGSVYHLNQNSAK